MKLWKTIHVIIALLPMFPLAIIADEQWINQESEHFSALWKFDSDGEIELILRNTSGKDLLVVVPSNFIFNGTITYLDDGSPQKEHTITTAIGMRNREIMVPVYSRDENEFGRENNVLVGRMEILEKPIKITRVSCHLNYCFLSDIKDIDSFAQVTKVLRTWKGVAKEDQMAKVRLP